MRTYTHFFANAAPEALPGAGLEAAAASHSLGFVGEVVGAVASPEVAGVALLASGPLAGLARAGLLSGGLLGSMAHLHPAAGACLGCLSVAAGAGAVKLVTDSVDSVYARRLSEVRRHAKLQAPLGADLSVAVGQYLASLDWHLSVEQQGRIIGSCPFGNAASFLGGKAATAPLPSDSAVRRQLGRQLHRIWRQCQEHPRLPPRVLPTTRSILHKVRRPSTPIDDEVGGHLRRDREKEAYDKLFEPQRDTVCDERGLCVAICYLLSAFLEFRHKPPARNRDAERRSLRLAVASLARHPVLDDAIASQLRAPGGLRGDARCVDFVLGSAALLCFIDSALAWRELDPFGWLGSCEDGAGLFLGHENSVYSYAAFAVRLRRCLKEASGGNTGTWRRLQVHLDDLRTRSLPDPWPWVWVQTHDASMLVRNRTKVPLRVELYRGYAAKGSPWADQPFLASMHKVVPGLMDNLASWQVVGGDGGQPLLSAEVGPGIEWAMRPRPRCGQRFRMRLLTEAGVVVCARGIRRGQTYDFHVPVPARPAIGRAGGVEDKEGRVSAVIDDAASTVGSTAAPPSSSQLLVGSLPSMCSTAAPPASSQLRVGFLPSTGAHGSAQALPLERSQSSTQRLNCESQQPFKMASTEIINSVICPRCLRAMMARSTRPAAAIYVEGVKCDHCSTELVTGRGVVKNENFFHCGKCWFDLCHRCGLREMRETWWGDD